MFSGKKVIVTGGLKGIGKAIVKRFLEEGAIVCTTYCNSGEKLEEYKEEFSAARDRLFIYKMDVKQYDEVSAVMEQMMEQMDGIDVLVNNAGIIRDNLFFKMSEQEWDDVIKTNLYGPFYTSKKVILNMVINKSGCIINISSVYGTIGGKGQCNYAASKHGLIGLTKSLAKEYAHKNIRVNAVAPGYIDTDMTKSSHSTGKDRFSYEGGINRMGTPEEVADAVVYLASDKASYITGQVLLVDGGVV